MATQSNTMELRNPGVPTPCQSQTHFSPPPSPSVQEGTPTPQLRGHLIYSHALNLGLPPSEKLLQTLNPPKKPQMMGPPDGS